MKPTKDEIETFNGNWVAIANHFGVSERTARRWLESYGLYHPKKNYGSHKLNSDVAKEIRARHTNEGLSIKDLAKEYEVTFATISRILHNFTYPDPSTAKVSVTYNPKET